MVYICKYTAQVGLKPAKPRQLQQKSQNEIKSDCIFVQLEIHHSELYVSLEYIQLGLLNRFSHLDSLLYEFKKTDILLNTTIYCIVGIKRNWQGYYFI